MTKIWVMVFGFLIFGILGNGIITGFVVKEAQQTSESKKVKAMVGAYYFDGWAGKNTRADIRTKNAPTHLTQKMVEEFPDREPIWGWRDDSLSIMMKQIDLASENGISFFSFCWYWHDDSEKINDDAIKNDPKHTSLNLFVKSPNNDKMKFCLMVSNHSGFKIKGTENWKSAASVWVEYFENPNYLFVDGKPFVIIYDGNSGSKEAFSEMEKVAQSAGFKGITFAGAGKFISSAGFSYQTNYNIAPISNTEDLKLHYSDLKSSLLNDLNTERKYPYIPVITSGWNRQPWEGKTGRGQKPGKYIEDRTPEEFGSFLQETISWMDKNPDRTSKERLILIYAWNELGEGGYIVPTKGDPDGKFLKAIKKVVKSE